MKEKLKPIPPIFPTYGNLPTSYQVSLSYPEQLHDLRIKLNQVILEVNTFLDLIQTLENNYNSILDELNNINSEIDNINNYFPTFRSEILNSVESRLIQNYNSVINLLSDYQTIFNNKLLTLRSDLEQEIERIELGDIQAYNPTNGEVENISKVIMDIYDILRNNAISVNEFEALELTATEFDEKEITAYNFDVNGKTFLLEN